MININLDDLARAAVDRTRRCPSCGGSGWSPFPGWQGELHRCPVCEGFGQITEILHRQIWEARREKCDADAADDADAWEASRDDWEDRNARHD